MMIPQQLLASGGFKGPPEVTQQEGDSATSTSVTFTFDATPVNGETILLFYRTTSGAPTTTPAGFTLWYSLDNNSLGMYVYTKVASSESNSYQFGDAASNYKGVVGVCVRGFSSMIMSYINDSGATGTATNFLPTSGTISFNANTLNLVYVVLEANRAITRSPVTAIIASPTDGSAGTFKSMLMGQTNLSPIAYQIQLSWPSATKNKAISFILQ